MSEANIFLIINLASEMFYVIDQRLKAQQVAPDKSTQVMRDLTFVLLDPKFIRGLIVKKKPLINSEHCKAMLNEISCCSIMRLDQTSMEKLWDLMTMIFKWQMFVSKHPQHLLDITFRHMDGIGKLFPEVKKSILVDYTKNSILDFWNQQDFTEQEMIFKTIVNWLEPFSVKISILIRLGFQLVDGSFVDTSDKKYFQEFIEYAGDNIYNKSAELDDGQKEYQNQDNSNAIKNFANQLKLSSQQLKNKNEGYIIFDDLNVDIEVDKKQFKPEFSQLSAAYVPSNSWENIIVQKNISGEKDLNSLLKTKLS